MNNLASILQTDPNYLVQKVHLYEPSRIKFPCIVQEKYDGVFCIAHKSDDNIGIYSRTGKEYLSMEHLKPQLRSLMNSSGTDFIIFEAHYPKADQSIISGKCRDTKNQHIVLCAIVHDCLTMSEWQGCTSTSYHARWNRLVGAMQYNSAELLTHIVLPNSIIAKDITEINGFCRKIWRRGGEGVVIKNRLAGYSRGKRNCDLMKRKRNVSYDLEVVDIASGTGLFSKSVGSLICKWKDGKTISVGTGLTHAQRNEWFANPHTIIGQIVEVAAMMETADGMLREPVFTGIRYDKEQGDF